MKRCKHDGCSKRAAKGRKECNTCKSRKWIAKNRIRFIWHMLKKSAKKRYLIFDLSYEYFEKLILQSGYIGNSGRSADSLTIDRRENHLGYIEGNLQVITKSANSTKYNQVDKVNHDEYVGDIPF